MKKTTFDCWLFTFFFLAAMQAHGGEVVVTADNNIKDVGLESSKRADEGKMREVIVKLQPGYVLDAAPTVGSDPGSAWMVKAGGKGDNSATFVGLQIKGAISPKVYAPKFNGDAVRKKSKGSGGKGGGEKPVDEFDWKVTGRYMIAECTFETGWVDRPREFVGPQYDDTLERLSEIIYVPVEIEEDATYMQAALKVNAVMREKEKEITGNIFEKAGGFFKGDLVVRYIRPAQDGSITNIDEACKKCGGLLVVNEFVPAFVVDLDKAQIYCPQWKNKPDTLNGGQKKIDDLLFVDTKKHELKHQEYHMKFRNRVLQIGKSMASRVFRIKACVSKQNPAYFEGTYKDEHKEQCDVFIVLTDILKEINNNDHAVLELQDQ